LIESTVEIDRTTAVTQHEDLMTRAKKDERRHGKPVIGLVYMGLQGLDDKTGSGIKARLIVDVYLLGIEGQARLKGPDAKDVNGLTILDQVRKGIRGRRGPGHTVWQFVHELPTAVGIGDLEFVQRWATVVAI
jgi:hypothetical protein